MAASETLFGLTGRRALVTGSSAGVGHALALGLAEAGAAVVLNGRNQLRLDEAALALSAHGGAVDILPFDVTSPDDVNRAIDRFEAETGPIDILVNATGMALDHPVEALPAGKFDEIMRTLAHAALHTGQAVSRHMKRRGTGRIVTICAPERPGAGAVSAGISANGALIALTRAMAAELGPHGITVNGLGLGALEPAIPDPVVAETMAAETERRAIARVPLGRTARLEDLVGPLVFLASPAAAYVSGQILWVDGGRSVLV